VQQGWEIGNEVNRCMARVKTVGVSGTSSKETAYQKICAALQTYGTYNQALRLERSASDSVLSQSIDIALLDCHDAAALANADLKQPVLPELKRNAAGTYEVPYKWPYCIRMACASSYWQTVYLNALNCSALGKVEFLGDTSLKPGDNVAMWHPNKLGKPFVARSDDPTLDTVDRIIVFATTEPMASLRQFRLDHTLQQVIDGMQRTQDRDHEIERDTLIIAGPEGALWAAVLMPILIRKQLV
jgi:hypothetical protein